MYDHVWVKIEPVPAYFRGDNPLSDDIDYRVFINQAIEHLHADAVRCYRKHGRGVVVLGRPNGVFLEGWYGLPRNDQRSVHEAACLKDLLQYDPVRELLVGIGDGDVCPVCVWRLMVDQPTPAQAWRDFDLTTR
ncbi:MAG: hypothetical protein P4L84_30810 [Isosphaeraceae bacterium]|nr:hypothetical protein [Isosphaeraceae bacterium]